MKTYFFPQAEDAEEESHDQENENKAQNETESTEKVLTDEVIKLLVLVCCNFTQAFNNDN